jgi:hypothetical protein
MALACLGSPTIPTYGSKTLWNTYPNFHTYLRHGNVYGLYMLGRIQSKFYNVLQFSLLGPWQESRKIRNI